MLEEFKKCQHCELHKTRFRIILGTGPIPSDILVIGDAPTMADDTSGKPFTGLAGRLLKEVMLRAANAAGLDRTPSTYMMHALACRPCDYVNAPDRKPTPKELWACWDRVKKTIELVRPVIVVLAGRVAADLEPHLSNVKVAKVLHPDVISVTGGTQSKHYMRYCRDWVNIIKEVGY